MLFAPYKIFSGHQIQICSQDVLLSIWIINNKTVFDAPFNFQKNHEGLVSTFVAGLHIQVKIKCYSKISISIIKTLYTGKLTSAKGKSYYQLRCSCHTNGHVLIKVLLIRMLSNNNELQFCRNGNCVIYLRT